MNPLYRDAYPTSGSFCCRGNVKTTPNIRQSCNDERLSRRRAAAHGKMGHFH